MSVLMVDFFLSVSGECFPAVVRSALDQVVVSYKLLVKTNCDKTLGGMFALTRGL